MATKKIKLLPDPASVSVSSDKGKKAKRTSKEGKRSSGRRAGRSGGSLLVSSGSMRSSLMPLAEVGAFGVAANVADAWAVDKGHATSLGGIVKSLSGGFWDIDLRALIGGGALVLGVTQPKWFGGHFRKHAAHWQRAGLGIFGAYGLEKVTTMSGKAFKKDAPADVPAVVPAAAPGTKGITVGRVGGGDQQRIARLEAEAEQAIQRGNYDRALNLEDRIAKLQFGGGRAGRKAEALSRLQAIKQRDARASRSSSLMYA